MIPPLDPPRSTDGPPASANLTRSLPYDVEAERSVIGALLLDRDAIINVSQTLQAQDFYIEAHGVIYGAMLDLYERRIPADYVTLSDDLERRDLLARAGGRAYLLDLAADVPTAYHAQFYADIVARQAIRRRLIDAGQRIITIGYDDSTETDAALDRAEGEIFAIAERRGTHGFTSIREVLAGYLDRLDYIHEHRGEVVGTPSGFIDLDRILGGMQRSDLIVLAARPAMGKCLAWDTLIVDPRTGERATIQQFVEEQRPVVLGMSSSGGVETKQISHWIDSGIKPCFRVRTRTGREVTVTGHHPFFTINGWTPLHDLSVGDAIAVPSAVPVFGRNSDVPEDLVRLLAYYIAEGSLTKKSPGFTNTDPVIIEDFKGIIARRFPACAVRQEGLSYYAAQPKRGRARGLGGIMPPNPVRVWLETFGIYGKRAEDKYIPACVWTWDRARLALFLRVLMSCDGSIYRNGPANPRIEFGITSQRLANDVHHALARFGIISHLYQKTARCWAVLITSRASVTRYQREIGWLGEKAARFADHVYATHRGRNAGHLPRGVWPMVRLGAASHGLSMIEVARRAGETTKTGKLASYNPHTRRGLPISRASEYARILQLPQLAALCHPDIYWDEITQIEPIGPQQVYDLTVPDGANFVANDIFVHNTAMALSVCHNTAVRYKSRVAIFSLEMGAQQLVQRMLCMEGGLDSSRLRSGHISEDEWGRLIQAAAALSETDVYIDDSSGVSTMEMRSKVRRLHSERRLDLVIVDYLQLMQGKSASENRVQEISKITRELKNLARELDVPVMALSQVSRAVDARTNHVPMLSDLRESGSIEQDADVVLFLYRDKVYNPDTEKEHVADLYIAKHRNGATGQVSLFFNETQTRFVDLAPSHGGGGL